MSKILPTVQASEQFKKLAAEAGGVGRFAAHLGVTRETVNAVINREPLVAGLWLAMSSRLAKADLRIRRAAGRAAAEKATPKEMSKGDLRRMLAEVTHRLAALEKEHAIEAARKALASSPRSLSASVREGLHAAVDALPNSKAMRSEVDRSLGTPGAYTRDEKPATAAGYVRDPVTGGHVFNAITPTEARRLAATSPRPSPSTGYQRDPQTGNYVMNAISPKEARANARGER